MLKLQDILRAGTIKRWHIVNTAREQTLAEHQYNVAILTQELCRRLGYAAAVSLQLVALALVHDAGECKTGDIPTPAKKLLRRELGERFEQVMSRFDVEPTGDLPTEYKHVLKCCDYLDSMLFLNENGVGRHAKYVMADILDSAHTYFAACGSVGVHALLLWRELENAEYSI